MSRTRASMTIEKAAALADASGIADLIEAVNEATAQGWRVVDFSVDDDGTNIVVKEQTGVMVGWFLDEWDAQRLQVIGGEEDLHITLAYLGDMADLTLEQQRVLVGIVAEVAAEQTQLYGVIGGTDTFPATEQSDGDVPWFACVDVPGLVEFREALSAAMTDAGLPIHNDFDSYTPHVTLQYLAADQEPPAVELSPTTISIDKITVALGSDRRDIDLQRVPYVWLWEGETPSDADLAADAWWKARDAWFLEQDSQWVPSSAYRPFAKSVVGTDESQFTLGPWYIPNMVDAHGDWTDPDEIQSALWDYVDDGDRDIRLQHMPDVVAGRWVEAMTLPFATTWPVIDPNGNESEHDYPAGTVMLGVIWEDWAWVLVKEGKITGYSIGGTANLDEVDFEPTIVTDESVTVMVIPDSDGLAMPGNQMGGSPSSPGSIPGAPQTPGSPASAPTIMVTPEIIGN